MIHKRKHKNPKALVVGIGKWGKVMTKCLINFGYKVKYANKIMRLRIILQAVAIMLIIMFVYFKKRF